MNRVGKVDFGCQPLLLLQGSKLLLSDLLSNHYIVLLPFDHRTV
ncbi:hypothetical protein DJ93_695 [Bacillus clarus]|uniref:Uncharacterized protein n=1 Tax=Bacillus clarus TaxID=2338372 RepID=A0A090Z9Z9_9BACI|nr:hypothetical protein DJ93_695 [Bacillus clarus]